MKKLLCTTILFLLCTLTVFATDTHRWLNSQTVTPTHTIHWMPSHGSNACAAPVNRYSDRTVNGVVGKRADGTTICFAPRRHRG